MLDLKKSAGKTVENFFDKVEKFLVEEAQVRAREQCEDIDEITTKDYIREALEKQFGPLGLQDSAIRGLRKAYVRTQMETRNLLPVAAFKLLAAGKVKIGWVNSGCRCPSSAASYALNDCDKSNSCRKCGGVQRSA